MPHPSKNITPKQEQQRTPKQEQNLTWQQQMLGSSVSWLRVVAALYAYSCQVHGASGVPDYVDVPVPKPDRPGALGRLAGTGA